jgi:hypothetical protein
MKTPRKQTDPLAETTPPRYKKTVCGVKVDPYRILALYEITHPAHQHALKKLLRNGKDPDQSLDEDIQEVIDSLRRWQEMRREDRQGELD